jgi:glycosyltransferase involved in cell wall biosynthesis
VTTHVGGVSEAAGPHSLYSKHSSPDDLAEKVVSLLDNRVDRRTMIDAGVEHVKKFNYYNITRTFVEYLEECSA